MQIKMNDPDNTHWSEPCAAVALRVMPTVNFHRDRLMSVNIIESVELHFNLFCTLIIILHSHRNQNL